MSGEAPHLHQAAAIVPNWYHTTSERYTYTLPVRSHDVIVSWYHARAVPQFLFTKQHCNYNSAVVQQYHSAAVP